ncbi:MAG: serine/threonine protein kinase, partial [Deltaproteobacteria bacterium]|nr:serine/threonine protein kinase [Deltaproteobacteria bacterium]
MLPISDHLLERLLARGATSEVWSATRMGPDGFTAPVALKTLTTQHLHAPERVEAFVAEARAGATVLHPNVVHTQALLHADGRYWLAMQLVRGWSVAALLARSAASGRPIPLPIAVAIARDAASGLEAIHAVGLVHGDIAPDNLMLAATGHAMVLDFGAATARNAVRPRLAPAASSYAAPELRTRTWVEARADVWSLGAVLRELVPEELEVPFLLDSAIARALNPDPTRRFPSAGALAIALELIARREGWLVTPSDVAAHLRETMAAAPPRPLADGSHIGPLAKLERPAARPRGLVDAALVARASGAKRPP